MAKRKNIILKQLQSSTQEVQYAEAMIEERSRLEKEIKKLSILTSKRVIQRSSAEKKHVKCQKRHCIYHTILYLIRANQRSFEWFFDMSTEYNDISV